MRDAFVSVDEFGSGVETPDTDITILAMDDTQRRRSWSVDDIVQDLGVSSASVRRWIAAGYLRAIRVGPKLFRIRQEDYDAFLAAGGVPPKGTKEEDKAK